MGFVLYHTIVCELIESGVPSLEELKRLLKEDLSACNLDVNDLAYVELNASGIHVSRGFYNKHAFIITCIHVSYNVDVNVDMVIVKYISNKL